MKSSSPKKGGACTAHAPIPKLLNNSQQSNFDIVRAQPFCAPTVIWRGWEVEAGRLFREFWQTSDPRHLRAFATHVYAMRRIAGRRR